MVLYAAVVVPIILADDPGLVFVRRAAHLRRNPGQIAFPGGLVDPEDADERAAAMREFEEELGVARRRLRIVDRLEDVVTLALSVTVTPYLGLLDPPAHFTVDRRETESVHVVPLASLYAAGALRLGIETTLRGDRLVDVPSWLFDHDELHVWGATARILHALVSRYQSVESIVSLAPLGLRTERRWY